MKRLVNSSGNGREVSFAMMEQDIMDECKEKLEKVHKDVTELDKFIDELGSDYLFFLKHRDKIKDVFGLVEKEFSEAKSCPLPAVKVDGECKDTSLVLEPVVGRYVPSEDIFYEIDTLIDAGALGKLKDKLKELEGYLESVVGGYSCPVPEKPASAPDKVPLIMTEKLEDRQEDEPVDEDLEIDADAEIMRQTGEYMKLAKKKPRNETSKRRQWYKECMSEKLKGKKKGMTRAEWREFFKQAAQECKAENPYPKKKGGE